MAAFAACRVVAPIGRDDEAHERVEENRDHSSATNLDSGDDFRRVPGFPTPVDLDLQHQMDPDPSCRNNILNNGKRLGGL